MAIGMPEHAVIRLLLSLIAGGVLGYERSRKRIDAGFRTHILVCMSSCAVTLVNLHVFSTLNVGDPTRMPAQVISGVGFLGVGCILVTKGQRIKGVTTAAGLWAAACLGICIGAGDYIIAGFEVCCVFLALTVLSIVDKKLNQKTRYIRFYAEFATVSDLTKYLRKLQKQQIRITNLDSVKNELGDGIGVVISMHLKNPVSVEEFIAKLSEEEGEESPIFLSEL